MSEVGNKTCVQNFSWETSWNVSYGRQKNTRDDNINTDLSEVCCEDGRWMELAQGRVQWRALVLAALSLQILLPVLLSCIISNLVSYLASSVVVYFYLIAFLISYLGFSLSMK